MTNRMTPFIKDKIIQSKEDYKKNYLSLKSWKGNSFHWFLKKDQGVSLIDVNQDGWVDIFLNYENWNNRCRKTWYLLCSSL